MEQVNLDLTFSVLFNLAHQYTANEMYNEALNTYQVEKEAVVIKAQSTACLSVVYTGAGSILLFDSL